MKVILIPDEHDDLSRIIDTANDLLLDGCNDAYEVEIKFETGSKYMRTHHDEEQIKKFIYPDYES